MRLYGLGAACVAAGLFAGCRTPHEPTHFELAEKARAAGQNDVAIRGQVDRTAVVVVPGMGDSVQTDKAGILEIADVFVVNKADWPGEHTLVRELKEITPRRPIFETIATQGKGIVELLDGLFS